MDTRTLVLVGGLLMVGCGSGGSSGGDTPDAAPAADADYSDFPDAMPFTAGVSTLAGSGEAGDRDGPRNVALFHNPVNVAVGPDGRVYVADFDNSAVRRISSEGDVSTLTSADTFVRPFGLAFDGNTFYVQTDRNATGERGGALWRVDLATGEPTLVVDDVGFARGIAVLPDGRLVLADFLDHYLRIYDPVGGSMTVLAGAKGQAGHVDGTGGDARFDAPYDLVVDTAGDIIVADQDNHRLRRVTTAGVVTTITGDGTAASADGTLATAQLHAPQGLAVDASGVLYVSDRDGFRVRRVDLEADEVTTIAGNGTAGHADTDDPLDAQFFGLEGIDITADGQYLYLADGNRGETDPYHRIRRIELAP